MKILLIYLLLGVIELVVEEIILCKKYDVTSKEFINMLNHHDVMLTILNIVFWPAYVATLIIAKIKYKWI